MAERELFGGLIRQDILHQASREAIFGMGIMDELAQPRARTKKSQEKHQG